MFCEQRAPKNTDMASSGQFVNFLGGLDLSLLKRNVLRQVIWLTPFSQSQQLKAN